MSNPGGTNGESAGQADRFWTIPNVLCLVRLFGAFGLPALAVAGLPIWFVAVYLILAATDLIDGPIARWTNQNSTTGAGLDTIADLWLSFCLLTGAAILSWEMIRQEWILIVVAVASYVVAASFGYWKFRKIPSYHTYSAKITHFLVALAGISLVLGWTVWLLRIASVAVILTNVESLAITNKLDQWKTDVASIFFDEPGSDVN